MRFGYFTLTDNPPTYGSMRRDANQLLLDTVDESIAAERLGFNSVWLPEHHFGGFGVLPTPASGTTSASTGRSRFRSPRAAPGSTKSWRSCARRGRRRTGASKASTTTLK